jgi:hypothetical protein
MNAFLKWLGSPLSQWHVASLQHKLLIAAAGAGAGYYLYQKKPDWPKWKVGLCAAGAAYGASMILHAAGQFAAPALTGAPAPAPLPYVPGTMPAPAPVMPSGTGPMPSGAAPAPPPSMVSEGDDMVDDDGMGDDGDDDGIFG